MSTQKSFAKGAEFPPLKDDVLRLYSMRFCPFAQRTRLVLAHKNIPHETVNVDLKNKPDWFLARNPLGLVPTLEKNDKIVYESSICDDYLDEVYPGNNLLAADPYAKAKQKLLMEQCSKLIPPIYKTAAAKTPEELKAAEEIQKALVPFEDALGGKYFGGDSLSMVDVHIWPFFERLPAIQILAGVTIFDEKQFPRLAKWIKVMHETPAVKATMFDSETHVKFFKSYMGGNPPAYDMGLD